MTPSATTVAAQTKRIGYVEPLMENPSKRHPPTHYMPNEKWPHGTLTPDAPPEAHLAAALAIRLRKHMKGRTLDKMAERTGLGRQTINNILLGKAWPDIRTVARLEVALSKRLWGKEHLHAAAQHRAAQHNTTQS